MVNRWIAWARKTFPEQRLFLKSDEGTRFLRLSTQVQIGVLATGAVVLGWTIFSTSVLLMDSLSSGTAREQALREQAVYGERLNALSQERDARVDLHGLDRARRPQRWPRGTDCHRCATTDCIAPFGRRSLGQGHFVPGLVACQHRHRAACQCIGQLIGGYHVSSFTASSTASAWPGTLTLRQI